MTVTGHSDECRRSGTLDTAAGIRYRANKRGLAAPSPDFPAQNFIFAETFLRKILDSTYLQRLSFHSTTQAPPALRRFHNTLGHRQQAAGDAFNGVIRDIHATVFPTAEC